jgi:pyridoxal phosphate enzyme (YggS family)
MSELQDNLRQIQARIHAACARVQRDPAEVKLLLATKTVSATRILEAFGAGYTLIAENKVQEVKEKYEELKAVPHSSHFIGHLQTNKIKDLLKCGINCIQSVDRLDLAEKLQQRLEFEDKTMNVFIQVNTSAETSKFGVSPADAEGLIKAVSALDRLKIRGLMTIGLFSAEEAKVRACYSLLKQLQGEISGLEIPGVDLAELSMGMSSDLEIAIEEGATLVRVGTAVFGQRKYPDSYYWNEAAQG